MIDDYRVQKGESGKWLLVCITRIGSHEFPTTVGEYRTKAEAQKAKDAL